MKGIIELFLILILIFAIYKIMETTIKKQCMAELLKGERKGQTCGVNLRGDNTFCSKHNKTLSRKTPVQNPNRISNIPKKVPLQPIREEVVLPIPNNSPVSTESSTDIPELIGNDNPGIIKPNKKPRKPRTPKVPTEEKENKPKGRPRKINSALVQIKIV